MVRGGDARARVGPNADAGSRREVGPALASGSSLLTRPGSAAALVGIDLLLLMCVCRRPPLHNSNTTPSLCTALSLPFEQVEAFDQLNAIWELLLAARKGRHDMVGGQVLWVQACQIIASPGMLCLHTRGSTLAAGLCSTACQDSVRFPGPVPRAQALQKLHELAFVPLERARVEHCTRMAQSALHPAVQERLQDVLAAAADTIVAQKVRMECACRLSASVGEGKEEGSGGDIHSCDGWAPGGMQCPAYSASVDSGHPWLSLTCRRARPVRRCSP